MLHASPMRFAGADHIEADEMEGDRDESSAKYPLCYSKNQDLLMREQDEWEKDG
jgi:hypothetical protein